MTVVSDTDLVTAAAEAAAAVLPSAEPLSPAGAQPGNEHVTGPFAGAATAELDAPAGGRITLLVAADLVEALSASPLGGLDLAAALQPAVDAAAQALGTTARAARVVELPEVASGFDGRGFTVVPLLGSGFGAAVLVSDDALQPSGGSDAGAPTPAEPLAATFPEVADLPTNPTNTAATPAPVAASPAGALGAPRGIEMLHGVDMEVTVELGRTRMTVRDLLALSPGAVLELDRAAGSPADLLVNGRLIARGEVVVVDEDFGLRVTEIIEDAQAS